ncbi:(2Fe-2S)-binding protein [Candidatus Sumerlaeota bacterium]|nr:(2Fe-2S)-binding protein [Candidatus Sumerlaeota bacterium]
MNLILNGKTIEAKAGQTVLQAARQAGVEIPTLCYEEGVAPRTSCFLCAVKVEGQENLQPACALPATEGLAVETDSAEVVEARRMALELLFSDHAGGCVAPCAMACPAHLDAARFIAEFRAGRVREAIATVKRRLALPAVLGRVCEGFCEAPCIRKRIDEPIAIRCLHGHVAELDLASGNPYRPAVAPSSGKRVAIVGAGPAGLGAAWHLAQEGHACVLFDKGNRPGGLLRAIPDERLDKSVLDAEIDAILRLGATFHGEWELGRNSALDGLLGSFDAVLLAMGAAVGAPREKRRVDFDLLKGEGLEVTGRGVDADPRTHATRARGVFAAGEVAMGRANAVRCVAAGREAAAAIDQFLRGKEVAGEERPFYFWRRDTSDEEIRAQHGEIGKTPRAETTAGGFARGADAAAEAARCLQCDCARLDDCRLREYARLYGANPYRFHGERRALEPDASHAEIVYEPGKCILCGLCIQIAQDEGEALGLSFAGRGFPTRVVVPLGGDFSQGLAKAARRCAEACPTAALTLKPGAAGPQRAK